MHFPFVFIIILLACISSLFQILVVSSHEFGADGRVLELDDSNFEKAISSIDYMFVDFYAPWCGHCQRLSPELDKAAPVLANLEKPIVIAKVNADKFRSLARKYDIDGFPTLKVFMHGQPVDYYGPRKADLLVRFLKKFVAPDVALLESDGAISNFIKSSGTYFPIYIGFGLNESTISEYAIKYKKKAWFSVAKDFSEEAMLEYDVYKAPALLALHPTYKERNVFYGPFEDKFMEDYIKQNLLPLVMPVTYDTLNSLNDDDREIVLTIMENDSSEKSLALIKLLRAAASANRDLIFGYLGFKQWEDFAETFDVDKNTKLPKMVVWNKNEEYLTVIGSESVEEEDQGSQITQFIEGYRNGKTEKKRISGLTFLGFVKSLIGVRSVYIVIFMVVVLMLIWNINKSDEYDVGPQRRQRDDAIEPILEDESAQQPYRPEDKED
ncbi:protein disulfide-isomerase [Ranunculus cassubicifolius]